MAEGIIIDGMGSIWNSKHATDKCSIGSIELKSILNTRPVIIVSLCEGK